MKLKLIFPDEHIAVEWCVILENLLIGKPTAGLTWHYFSNLRIYVGQPSGFWHRRLNIEY